MRERALINLEGLLMRKRLCSVVLAAFLLAACGGERSPAGKVYYGCFASIRTSPNVVVLLSDGTPYVDGVVYRVQDRRLTLAVRAPAGDSQTLEATGCVLVQLPSSVAGLAVRSRSPAVTAREAKQMTKSYTRAQGVALSGLDESTCPRFIAEPAPAGS